MATQFSQIVLNGPHVDMNEPHRPAIGTAFLRGFAEVSHFSPEDVKDLASNWTQTHEGWAGGAFLALFYLINNNPPDENTINYPDRGRRGPHEL
jgi:hypothetical protein